MADKLVSLSAWVDDAQADGRIIPNLFGTTVIDNEITGNEKNGSGGLVKFKCTAAEWALKEQSFIDDPGTTIDSVVEV